MRGFFSGNRPSAPLGPPKHPSTTPPPTTKGETIQALRQRQREKQKQFVLQMMRAEKEKQIAQQQGDTAKLRDAEKARRDMASTADALSAQLTILDRIMEEVGLTAHLEEEDRENRELYEESREVYEEELAEAEEQIRENIAQGEYMSTMASPFMMPSDVFDDEDSAMREVDEVAIQTGRN